jgi:hypothetical protein
MRSVSAAAFAAFVLAALPACDTGPFDPASSGPDAGLECPLPAPEGCSESECFSQGGCMLFTCDHVSGTWQTTFCESPPAAIDGRWTLTRQLEEDPCPEVTRVDPLELQAAPAIGGGAAISSLDGTRLSLGETRLGFGQTQVVFGFDETWSAGEQPLPVRVSYDLDIQLSGDIYGQASATVMLGERTCDYAFQILGERH